MRVINKRVTYAHDTGHKTPTQIEQELKAIGVNGFVVKVDKNIVTMLIDRQDTNTNREAMQNGKN